MATPVYLAMAISMTEEVEESEMVVKRIERNFHSSRLSQFCRFQRNLHHRLLRTHPVRRLMTNLLIRMNFSAGVFIRYQRVIGTKPHSLFFNGQDAFVLENLSSNKNFPSPIINSAIAKLRQNMSFLQPVL